MPDILGDITPIGHGSGYASQTHTPYVLDAQQTQDLNELIAHLKSKKDEQVEDASGAQAGLQYGAHSKLHHVSHAAVAGGVREAAHIAEGQGKLDLARQLEHLAEMIEKGEVVLA
jgi:hypothetical protein